MARGDLTLREDLARDGSLFQGYHPRMRRGLTLLRGGVSEGEVSPLEFAMLEDRIRTFERRPQRYGTQFDWDEHGRWSPLPLEDPAGVDARRREIGLGPLDQDLRRRSAATARRRERGPRADRPPADWAARQRDMETWLRQVGWRD